MLIICNSYQTIFFKTLIPKVFEGNFEFSFILNNDELDEKITTLKNEPILIEILLDRQGTASNNYYGFDIANALRTKYKVTNPIIFFGIWAKNDFANKTDVKYNILNAPATSYIKYPCKNIEIKNIVENSQPLTQAGLHDVATMFCNLKGILKDKLNHDIKIDSKIKEIVKSVKQYLNDTQLKDLNIDNYEKELLKYQKEKNPIQFNNTKELFKKNFNLYFDGGQNTYNPILIHNSTKKHKILVLDDDTDWLAKIKKNMSSLFEIKDVQTSNEAIKILNDDIKNEYMAVICDWRLYEKDTKTAQQIQGYDVLEIAAKNSFRALIALTSQDEQVVRQIRNIQQIHYDLFSKDVDLRTEEQFGLFNKIVYEKCLQITELIENSIFTSSNWNRKEKANGVENENKSLKTELQKLYQSKNKASEFELISILANQMISYIECVYNFDDDAIILECGSICKEFSLELPSQLVNLFSVLVYRRVWLYVYCKLKTKENAHLTSYTVYCLIFHPSQKYSKDLKKSLKKDIDEDSEKIKSLESILDNVRVELNKIIKKQGKIKIPLQNIKSILNSIDVKKERKTYENQLTNVIDELEKIISTKNRNEINVEITLIENLIKTINIGSKIKSNNKITQNNLKLCIDVGKLSMSSILPEERMWLASHNLSF
jgi:hypothetical protein